MVQNGDSPQNWSKLDEIGQTGQNRLKWSQLVVLARMMKDAQKMVKISVRIGRNGLKGPGNFKWMKDKKNLCLQDLWKFDQTDQDLPTPIYLISGRIECEKNQKY